MTSDRPALGVDPSEVTGVWGRRLDGRIALERDVIHLPDRRPSVAATASVFGFSVLIAAALVWAAAGSVAAGGDEQLIDGAIALAALLLAAVTGLRLARLVRRPPDPPPWRTGLIAAEDGIAVCRGGRATVIPRPVLLEVRERIIPMGGAPFASRVEALIATDAGPRWVEVDMPRHARRALATWLANPGSRLQDLL